MNFEKAITSLDPCPMSKVIQFLSFKNYFPAHYFLLSWDMSMTLLVPTLRRRKENIPSFYWKFVPTLIRTE